MTWSTRRHNKKIHTSKEILFNKICIVHTYIGLSDFVCPIHFVIHSLRTRLTNSNIISSRWKIYNGCFINSPLSGLPFICSWNTMWSSHHFEWWLIFINRESRSCTSWLPDLKSDPNTCWGHWKKNPCYILAMDFSQNYHCFLQKEPTEQLQDFF